MDKPQCEKITKLRKELGWSQNRLAEEYGISVRTIQGWESKNRPDKPSEWAARLLIEDMKQKKEDL